MKHVVLALWVSVTLAAALLVISRTACEDPKPKRTPPNIGSTTHPSQLPGARGTLIAGVMYWLPPTWQMETITGEMRDAGLLKQIRMGPEPDALTSVAYVGTDADVVDDARIYEWAAEFDGGPAQVNVWGGDDVNFSTGGCHLRLLLITGTWRPPLPPQTNRASTAPSPAPAALPDHAMFIALARGGDTAVFFRVTGPRKAVEAERRELMAFLSSVSKVRGAGM